MALSPAKAGGTSQVAWTVHITFSDTEDKLAGSTKACKNGTRKVWDVTIGCGKLTKLDAQLDERQTFQIQ